MHKINFTAVDGHTHLRFSDGWKAIAALYDEEQLFGHANYTVASLEGCGENMQDQNAVCLANKREHPETFTFCGLNHDMGDFRAQAEKLWAAGCDGFKMIEGKPDTWKRWNVPLDDACYDGFYSFCTEVGAPLLIHIADPENFWDIDKIAQEDIDMGWYYDDTHPSKEYLTQQAISVMEKFPGMTIIFAHFMYLSEHLPRMGALLDRFENMYTDITPGAELFSNFTDTYDDSVAFFNKYKTRIMYGSDTADFHTEGGVKYMSTVVDKIRRFISTEDEMTQWNYRFKGLNLPADAQELIYSKNYLRVVKHREIDASKAKEYFQAMLKNPSVTLSDSERANIASLWR
jgi:Predicted metal-dependent hydrolase of the TIM-barrel fold